MTAFTTYIYFIASGNDLKNDLPYLQKIMEMIYKNHAIITRDWLGPVLSYKKRMSKPYVEQADWINIVEESLDAIKRSDLVISEVSFSDFNQGVQTYIAAQYKKPTLVLTRSQIEGTFISGISNRYLTVRQYSTQEELESVVSEFIQKNTIPAKDLRFNMLLNRHTYKYLRDKSYETGKNKSEIIRQIIQNKQQDI